MKEQTLTPKESRSNLVSQYFTPLAVLIVANGAILGKYSQQENYLIWGLLVFSVLFNTLSNSWIDSDPASRAWKITARVWLNLATNISFVYILGEQWPPVWLILLLSPLAAAIYGSRNRTIQAAFLAMAILLGAEYFRGTADIARWAQTVSHSLFIALISLAVYKLVQSPQDG